MRNSEENIASDTTVQRTVIAWEKPSELHQINDFYNVDTCFKLETFLSILFGVCIREFEMCCRFINQIGLNKSVQKVRYITFTWKALL